MNPHANDNHFVVPSACLSPSFEAGVCDLARLALATKIIAETVDTEWRAYGASMPQVGTALQMLSSELELLNAFILDVQTAATNLRAAFYRDAA